MENETKYWGMDEKTFMLLMHLSQYIVFFLPIIMWATNKEYNKRIDEQGKYITNWIISAAIYTIASSILTIVLIGILGLIAVGLAAIVFPIIGAIKSSNGEVWKYPLSIQFIK